MSEASATSKRGGAPAAMALRCVTALLGGYAASAGTAALVARILPIARVEATSWAIILSFLFYACVALWAFHEQRLLRVCILIWGIAAVTIGLALLIGVRP
ncbi:hypothetical protein PIB19_21700 [Sphingomonas sp. 7/4-4]|uniref:hypothetical protein n=1 Tax=Sphingomonas sp. 7/4-4 TaxID=3018446 RepID=UPI0022F3937D|nr:hypothetical protein [Sphingomonas sp. 7/4-4]WBY07839.1 hypothetical protein PIB19_21700 [Sphingomonas sp. 7/4-4]